MPRAARRLLIAAVVAVAAVLAVASVVSAATTVSLRASKTKLAFNHKTLTAKHGKVTLVMANPSGLPHAIAVEGHGIDKKGTYTFYCPVDGHKAAGMKGRLVVS